MPHSAPPHAPGPPDEPFDRPIAEPSGDGMPLGFDPRDVPDFREERPADGQSIGARDLAQWRSRVGRWLESLVRRLLEQETAAQVRWIVLLLTAGLGAMVTVGLSWATGEVYEDLGHDTGLAALDQPVLDAAAASRTPDTAHWVTVFTDIGGPVGMPMLAIALTAWAAWLWRSRTPVVLVVIGAAGALATTILGKDVIGRARPPQALAVPPYEVSASFPSGHTLNATVIMGLIAYVLIIRWRSRAARAWTIVVALVFALSMGLSRVWLGHHWLTDVVAGWLLGLFWVVVVVTAHRLWITADRLSPQPSGRGGIRSRRS